MIERDILQLLGWSDTLISEVLETSKQIEKSLNIQPTGIDTIRVTDFRNTCVDKVDYFPEKIDVDAIYFYPK